MPPIKLCLFLAFLSLSLTACSGGHNTRTQPSAAECALQPHLGREIVLREGSAPLRSQLRRGEVALTFDDGPHDQRTQPVLDILAASCVKAMFFLRGDKASEFPELVQRIAADGHLIGSHTHSHPRLIKLVPDAARLEIIDGITAISNALGSSQSASARKLFRFTYLQSNDALNELVEDLGLISVGSSILGRDEEDAPAEQVVQNVKTALSQNGDRGVILLHDPFENSDRNVELLIRALSDSGYAFVRVRLEPSGPAPR